jgi:hypothetical protein
MKAITTEDTEEHTGKTGFLCEVSSVKLRELCGGEVLSSCPAK